MPIMRSSYRMLSDSAVWARRQARFRRRCLQCSSHFLPLTFGWDTVVTLSRYLGRDYCCRVATDDPLWPLCHFTAGEQQWRPRTYHIFLPSKVVEPLLFQPCTGQRPIRSDIYGVLSNMLFVSCLDDAWISLRFSLPQLHTRLSLSVLWSHPLISTNDVRVQWTGPV